MIYSWTTSNGCRVLLSICCDGTPVFGSDTSAIEKRYRYMNLSLYIYTLYFICIRTTVYRMNPYIDSTHEELTVLWIYIIGHARG